MSDPKQELKAIKEELRRINESSLARSLGVCIAFVIFGIFLIIYWLTGWRPI